MNKIKFSYVWDKLNDPQFSTIRSWDKEKEDYYRSRIGQEFQVWKSKGIYPFRLEYVICHAYLLEVQVVDPKNIPLEVLQKDVSLNGNIERTWIDRIMKNKIVILLAFSKKRKGQQGLPVGGLGGLPEDLRIREFPEERAK
jgi:hypothetical protein